MTRKVEVESCGQVPWSREDPKTTITISGSTYIVVEAAIYRHTIFGPFADEQQARAAVAALEAISDGHHQYEVHRLEGHV
jgi:hypothetical protein